MYPVVYDAVHICTQPYTTQYIYVRSRIRLGTYMYAVVYDTVHICTQSYTTQYIYVPSRIRLRTYMYPVVCDHVCTFSLILTPYHFTIIYQSL